MSKAGDKVIAAPPYVSYATFKTFLEGLKASGVPNRVDRGAMHNMSGAVQSHLIAALNSMNLVTATSQPTDTLHKLVNSSGKEREGLLRELLRRSYPFFFEDGFNLGTDTVKHFDEQFNKSGVSSETGRKCKAFFIAATKDAGITLSAYILKGARGQKAATPRKPKTGTASNGNVHSEDARKYSPPTIVIDGNGLTQMLLQKFPTLDPGWPDEVKTKWFESFQKLMEMAAKD